MLNGCYVCIYFHLQLCLRTHTGTQKMIIDHLLLQCRLYQAVYEQLSPFATPSLKGKAVDFTEEPLLRITQLLWLGWSCRQAEKLKHVLETPTQCHLYGQHDGKAEL